MLLQGSDKCQENKSHIQDLVQVMLEIPIVDGCVEMYHKQHDLCLVAFSILKTNRSRQSSVYSFKYL